MANTTDKSILTAAGKALLAQLNAEEKPLIIDKMMFANVPNRPEFPQPDDVVPTDDIVHQEQVEQRGRLSADSVIYSTTLTSDVGPFEFNWTGAYCSEYGVLVTIDHHALTPKTADEPGVAGNTLVRSVVLEYKDIAEITNITVDASSWQYNATDRMKKMDSDVAQSIIDQNGKDWFIEDGFLVTPSGNAYNIKAGASYVSGNRVSMEFDRSVQVPNKPSFIYIDAHREGTPTGEQVTLFDFVITDEEKDDYIDSSTGKDIPHFVCKIAEVLADGSVSDLRPEGESASREWVLNDGDQYHILNPANKLDITDLLKKPDTKPRLLPPGEFHIKGDVVLDDGLVGTGVNETKLFVYGKLRIHEKKQFEFGNFSMHVMNDGMFELGSTWEGNYRPIKFTHETEGECACTIQSGGNSWGSQDNIFEKWFFNRCGLLTDLQGYFTANVFRKLTLFTNKAWHRILDSTHGCHGNMYESPIFQSATIINEHRQPQNLLTPYIENTDFQGLWNDMYSIQNNPFADPKSRDREVINKTFSFSSLGYSHGEEIRLPFAPNVATVTEEEIKARYSGKQIDIFDEPTSVTGKAIRVTSPAGAYVRIYPFQDEIVSRYVSAFGFVTVSFDAKVISGDGGSVTKSLDGQTYVSPNVRGNEWRRYSYTIGGTDVNCGIFVSQDLLGQMEFCNFSLSSGRVGTQAVAPEYIKPFKNTSGEVSYQAQSEGVINWTLGDDVYYGRKFFKDEGESVSFKLWDTIPIYGYASIRFRLIVDDSTYPHGLYVAEGLIVVCKVTGEETVRTLDFINENLNGNGMEMPTVALTTDGLSVAMASGSAKVHLNIDYESTNTF